MPNRFAWVRADYIAVRREIAAPLAAVSMVTTAGLALEWLGLIRSFYASPLILATAAVSIRYGVRAGILTAVIMALVWDFVFTAPRWALAIPSRDEMVAYLSMLAAAFVGSLARRPVPRTEAPATPERRFPFQSARLKNGFDGDVQSHAAWWDVQETGHWSHDCYIGAEYGRIFLAESKHLSIRPMLGWIVRDMIARGRFTGVEAGFVNAIAAKALDEPAPQEILRINGPLHIARQDDTKDLYIE